MRTFAGHFVLGMGFALALPAVGAAQSAIAGVVKTPPAPCSPA